MRWRSRCYGAHGISQWAYRCCSAISCWKVAAPSADARSAELAAPVTVFEAPAAWAALPVRSFPAVATTSDHPVAGSPDVAPTIPTPVAAAPEIPGTGGDANIQLGPGLRRCVNRANVRAWARPDGLNH